MTDMDSVHKKAAVLLRSVIGEKCWHVSTGNATLPSFSMALGEKIPRERPLRYRDGTSFAEYTGRVSFYVWCTWRFQKGNRVLVSSDDDNEEIVKALQRLVGDKIAGIEIAPPAWDVVVNFTSGKRLCVFCDHTQVSPSYQGNWNATVGAKRIDVGPGTKITIQSA